jgi:RHS repeat-associated protein
VTTGYVYNALGQLIKKGTNTLYYYDEAGHVLGTYNGSGALVEEIVWLGDIPIVSLRPKVGGGINIYNIHTDHLNTPRLITGSVNPGVRWRWDAEPFGGGTVNNNPSGVGAFNFDLRFPGQIYVAETGLHYNYYRDYDPATGRYVQSDPIGLEGGLNTYAYVNGNPIANTDPTGEESIPFPRTIPFPGWAGPAAGVAGAGLGGWQIGSAIYPHIAQPLGDLIDKVCKSESREEQCNKQYYDVDIPTCRGIKRSRGPAAAAICYAAAMERYAACLRGEPMPPLHGWNNQ